MFWKAIDKLKETAAQATPVLGRLYELLQQDPVFVASLLQTVKRLYQEKTLLIPDHILKQSIVQGLEGGDAAFLRETAVCGLDSNRLLLYAEGEIRGISLSVKSFLSPLEPSVVWGKEKKLLCLRFEPPSIEATGTGGKIAEQVSSYFIGTLFPGILGNVAQYGLKKATQALTMAKVQEQLASTLPSCTMKGNEISFDLERWETTQALLHYSIPQTAYSAPLVLGELLHVKALSMSREGVLLHLEMQENSTLAQSLRSLWGSVFSNVSS